ncbi:MAG: lysoplasmalogenase [Spirochaetaceae bacterium]|jgi:uncharacterized membrane protein YhhN|nr:lysoplasmalogenase [Spirochaetaceae bacterium]
MDIIFFVLYIAAASINIFSIQFEKHRVRFISKICLVPILMAFYIYKSDNHSFIIMLAMAFSWCGDILLVNPQKLQLYAGITSFFTVHILYMLVFIDITPQFNWLLFVFSSFPILFITYFFIGRLHIPSNYIFPVIVYAGAIGLLISFSLQVFIWYKTMVSMLLAAGSVLFFISDTVLLYFNTVKPMTKKALIGVMSSYIFAQAGLVIGCSFF